MPARRLLNRGPAAVAVTLTLAVTLSAPLAGARASDPAHEPVDDPIPGHVENGKVQLKLQTLTAGRGLTAPNWGTFAPGVPRTLFVDDQDGERPQVQHLVCAVAGSVHHLHPQTLRG